MPLRKSLAFVLLLLVGACAAASADEPLRWKFNQGERLRYDMRQQMVSDVLVGGGQAGNMQTTMDQSMSLYWTVTEVNAEGNATIVQKFDRMQMKMSLPDGQSFEYDTDSDEAPQGVAAMLAPMLDAMVDCEITTVMTPQGEVIETTIPEKFVQALQNVPGVQLMGELATEEGLKAMGQQGTMKLPAGELTVGEVSTSRLEIKNPIFGKQIVDTTFTYRGTAEVAGETYEKFEPRTLLSFAKVEGDDANEPAQRPGPIVPTDFKVSDQSTSGEVLFDRAAGRLKSSRVEQKYTLGMSVEGQPIETRIKQTIDIEVKPIGTVEVAPDAAADAAEAAGDSE